MTRRCITLVLALNTWLLWAVVASTAMLILLATLTQLFLGV